MKKILSILIGAAVLALPALSQAADDGFLVPLDEDLTKSVSASSDNTGGGTVSAPASGPSIAQGLWIEATSSNKSIIRDIATGEKPGYEFDNSHLVSEANWWFWGTIGDKFQLDAEVSVWDFDKTLYQANSYAANVPDVTWGDGLQTLLTMPFSWIYNSNDDGVGALNKLGFTIATPYVNAKLGYGNLKANGMTDWAGIFHVLKRYDDHEKGFTELSLGNDFRQFGNLGINAVVGLSMVNRNSSTYGTYELLTMTYGEDEQKPLVNVALTFGSITDQSQLFFYNKSNKNDASAYIAVRPLERLLLEAHGLMSFGTSAEFGLNSLAGALRATWAADNWSLKLKQTVAGKDASSDSTYTWGKASTVGAGTAVTRADFDFTVNSMISFGLDEVLTFKNLSGAADYTAESLTLRNEPFVDLNFAEILGLDLSASLYGVISLDKPHEKAQKTGIFPYFEEAGIEVAFGGVPFVSNMVFDYAVQCAYANNSVSLNKEYSAMYHSFMLAMDVTDKFSVNGGAVIRARSQKQASDQPAGFALGCAMRKLPLPGSPMVYAHFTYGMDPYEDVNYSVFRADDPQNEPSHRTFLLNSLDSESTSSYIRLGFIWDL